MALMDLKSNLSWYGSPPEANYLDNTNAKGFTAELQPLAPSEFAGVNGEQYTHTGIQQLGTLKFGDWFLNDDALGFTQNMFLKGGQKKESQFVGIDGENFVYTGKTGIGDITKNIYSEIQETFESRFVFNDDLTVDVIGGKGFSRDGTSVESIARPQSADGFVIRDGITPDSSVSKRKAQLGVGSPWIGHKPGWYDKDGKKYGDQVIRADWKDDEAQLKVGLAHKYTKNTPIDDMYNKFNLREDAHQIGYIKHPLIVRGIQREGKTKNQRWGIGDTVAGQISSLLDLPRAGVLTSLERGAIDIARLGKFMVSPPGLAYIVKQVGQQLMNPNVESPDGKVQKIAHKNSTKLWTPVNQLLQPLAGLAGMHIRRHGFLPVDLPGTTPGTYGEVHTQRDTAGDHTKKNRLVLLGAEYGMAAGEKISLSLPTGKEPIVLGGSEKSRVGFTGNGILTGQTGPGSVGGIGSTEIKRGADSTLKTQFGDGDAKLGAGELKYSEYFAAFYHYGRPYQKVKDSTDSGNTRSQIDLGDSKQEKGPKSYQQTLAQRAGSVKKGDEYKGYDETKADWGAQSSDDADSVMSNELLGGKRKDKYKGIRNITKDRTPESSAIIDFRTMKDGSVKAYGDDAKLNPKKDKTLTVRGYPNFLPTTDGERKDQPDMYYNSSDPGLIGFYFNPVDPASSMGGRGNIGFRAYIDSLDDAFTPSWNQQQDQGRADSLIQYTGFARTVSVSFKVPVTSAGERKEVWKRLNRLARITMPKYGGAGFYGQFVRVTIGNLYRNIPMYINDLTYSWDAETPWEISKGEQVPFITNVDISLGWIGNSAPSADQLAYNYG
tara:strand:- start:1226 stop:3715 length:2490 start_codon:yes stop_codon:yes gene_type:complete